MASIEEVFSRVSLFRNSTFMRARMVISLFVTTLVLTPYASVVAAGPSDRVVPIYPVTTGRSQAPDTPITRVLVLSTHTGASVSDALVAAQDIFRLGGISVLEKSRSIGQAETQGPHRRETADTTAAFLDDGRSVGADHVVLVEVTDTLVMDRHRTGNTIYLHDERVLVKGIGVKTGRMVFEGTARWSQPIERTGDHIRELTKYAIARAICAPEKWVEASTANNGRGRCRG